MDRFPKMTTALMEARRQAQLQGRPLSSQEAEAIAAGYFQNAQERAAQSQAMNLQEDQLALEKWRQKKMMEAAGQGQTNALLSNLINTGGTLAGYKYFMGG
ncbi:MAG: hypothetical protein ABFD76_15405 [Smithella sp.]